MMLDAAILEKLSGAEARLGELEQRMGDPEVIGDPRELQRLGRELRRLQPVVDKLWRYRKLLADLEGAELLLGDPDMRDLAKEELEGLRAQLNALAQELRVLLLPRDPNDDRDVIIEIRAGTGGEEAALFAAALCRMYTRYADRVGWKVETLGANETELGGYKEISLSISGEGVHSRLKYEAGVHRVQRVPETEAQGRIHTSTVTVAVMPEAAAVDVQVNPQDLKIEVQRAGGAGGQHVNKTESAVRITHLPTGIVVYCADERSQHQNRDKAMRVLMARLYNLYSSQAHREEEAMRRAQVGTGERSERIRTYNFPENRLSDHRIKLTLYRLNEIIDGDLEEVMDALISDDQAAKLKELEG